MVHIDYLVVFAFGSVDRRSIQPTLMAHIDYLVVFAASSSRSIADSMRFPLQALLFYNNNFILSNHNK